MLLGSLCALVAITIAVTATACTEVSHKAAAYTSFVWAPLHVDEEAHTCGVRALLNRGGKSLVGVSQDDGSASSTDNDGICLVQRLTWIPI
jgi:hypothetical protein